MPATSFRPRIESEMRPSDRPTGSTAVATRLRGAGASRIVRRLARKLTPVILDLGEGQPRFASYLDWDEGRHAAVVFPIATAILGPALAARRQRDLRIRSQDFEEPWMLTARDLRIVGERSAAIGGEGLVVTRMGDRVRGRTRPRGQEPLVLAVHAGQGSSLDGHVFPIVGLGDSHCLIDSTSPLEPGEVLSQVEVIGELRIIRSASARVIEVIPWVTAQGDRRFWCRLALDEPRAPAVAGDGFDLLADAGRIARLFELGTMVELAGWYDAPGWPRARMRFVEGRDQLVALNVEELPPPDAIPLPEEIRLGFELFAVSYEGWVRLHRRRGSRLEVALPLVVRRRRRRREPRARVPAAAEVTLVFRPSAIGGTVRRPVRDLSFGGVCFEADLTEDILWKGSCLEGARIEWPGGRVVLGELEVRAVEKTATGAVWCHAANRGTTPVRDTDLILLLASLYHPDVERHDGRDYRAMLDLYERAGLLGEFMLRNLRPLLPIATASWRKLHGPRSTVACTLLYRQNAEAPQAAVSAVRVWEKTWFAQHFGALPNANRRAAGLLQLAYVDFVLPRCDAHYLAFFVKAGNARMNAFYDKFFQLTGTPEAVERVTVTLFTLRSGARPPAADCEPRCHLRVAQRSDERLISRAAERIFGPIVTSAMSLVPGGFGLPDTARRFASLELERSRSTFLITDGDRPAAVLFKERTSPGLNLTWMLDAWWLLPIGPLIEDPRGALAAATRAIACAPAEHPDGDKFLIVPAGGAPDAALAAAGFEKLLDAHLYVLNRSGLRRYYEYICDRYGELGARIARHDSQSARSAS
jgi:hypothetical protein